MGHVLVGPIIPAATELAIGTPEDRIIVPSHYFIAFLFSSMNRT